MLAAVIAADQITKAVFLDKTYPFLAGLVSINSNDLNSGAAWGFLSGAPWLLVVFAVIFIAAVLVFDIKFKGNSSAVYSVGVAFVLGGTVGNLIDRIFLGGVRDFLQFDFWPGFPIFNVADSFIFVGCILLLIYVLFIFKSKSKHISS